MIYQDVSTKPQQNCPLYAKWCIKADKGNFNKAVGSFKRLERGEEAISSLSAYVHAISDATRRDMPAIRTELRQFDVSLWYVSMRASTEIVRQQLSVTNGKSDLLAGTTSFAAVDSSVSFRDWSCSLEVTQAECTDFDRKYRRQDGTCNNLEKPISGAAFRPYSRLLPAEYDDGIGAPRGGCAETKRSRI